MRCGRSICTSIYWVWKSFYTAAAADVQHNTNTVRANGLRPGSDFTREKREQVPPAFLMAHLYRERHLSMDSHQKGLLG